jgi:hypothetical protein
MTNKAPHLQRIRMLDQAEMLTVVLVVAKRPVVYIWVPRNAA